MHNQASPLATHRFVGVACLPRAIAPPVEIRQPGVAAGAPVEFEGAIFHPPHFGLVFTGEAVVLWRLAACWQATPGVGGTPRPVKKTATGHFCAANPWRTNKYIYSHCAPDRQAPARSAPLAGFSHSLLPHRPVAPKESPLSSASNSLSPLPCRCCCCWRRRCLASAA